MSIPKDHEMVRPEIRALIERGKITVDELKDLRCNSYEWEAMVPALSIEALIHQTEHAIDNRRTKSKTKYETQRFAIAPIEHVPALTYDDAIGRVFAPQLIGRLRQAMAIVARDTEELRLARAAIQKAVDGMFDIACRDDAIEVLTELSRSSGIRPGNGF